MRNNHNKKECGPKGKRLITFTAAINEALIECMEKDPGVFVMGLGAPDPKGVFGTTLGLQKRFGTGRVFDMPISENAMTGVAIGAAISGMRPVMAHQRADFVLMAMDQIVNSAAKWHYMYGGQASVPLTIRTVVGRGWGQGPQHSQNFQALFAQVPGLKVVAPTTPCEAKGLLTASIEENNPVIFVEHRWLSNQMGDVPEGYYSMPLGKANVMRKGSDITVVASMDMALEAMVVADGLLSSGISVEVVNLRTVKPLDAETILGSVAKTGRLVVMDSSWYEFGVSAEIAAVVAEKGFDSLKAKVRRLGLPSVPTPTSPALAGHYYPSEADICLAIGDVLGVRLNPRKLGFKDVVGDVPDEYFKGPF
ncbi:MAG: transketolase C-terminal domain-containing protein [Thermodesulfovibrionales bacterium]|nr:transketolase C-terminal domain-containing protein [Thermodesulfovibrionales bacterium]